MTVAVIGGGIVGLATAYELLSRNPRSAVIILEKEAEVARHQTGHNSGVIHTGIYYKPGTAKALTCVEGGALLRRFCDENQIPYEQCGKIVVARSDTEVSMLRELHRRGNENGVPGLRLIGPEEIRQIEPSATGVAALHVPTAAIVDYRLVCRVLIERIIAGGGQINFSSAVVGVEHRRAGVVLKTTSGDFESDRFVACAGLHSDRVLRLSNAVRQPDFRIIPFRGEYYEVSRPTLVKGLIYPVPDPRFPFLGVHFTKRIDGSLEAGPNAVLAFAREGYRKRDFNPRDLIETLSYRGFWRLARKHWRAGAAEVYRSFSKRAFARALATLVPAITAADLSPAPAGVRAQALADDGCLYDDFLFSDDRSSVHVCNAPSPAATAAFAIAKHIVNHMNKNAGPSGPAFR